jgi:hypothetical protein
MVYAVTGGTLSIVQGSYEYHHYLQDGFNDSVIAILLPSNNCNMFLKLCVFLFLAMIKMSKWWIFKIQTQAYLSWYLQVVLDYQEHKLISTIAVYCLKFEY